MLYDILKYIILLMISYSHSGIIIYLKDNINFFLQALRNSTFLPCLSKLCTFTGMQTFKVMLLKISFMEHNFWFPAFCVPYMRGSEWILCLETLSLPVWSEKTNRRLWLSLEALNLSSWFAYVLHLRKNWNSF